MKSDSGSESRDSKSRSKHKKKDKVEIPDEEAVISGKLNVFELKKKIPNSIPKINSTKKKVSQKYLISEKNPQDWYYCESVTFTVQNHLFWR